MYKKSQQYKKDKIMGEYYENLLLKYLNENNIHDEKVIKRKDENAQIDYYSNNWEIELKSRRYFKKDFYTIMIGMNKLQIAEKCKKNVRFYWIFKDGVYYWDFKPNNDDLINYYYDYGSRKDRGMNETKMVGYVFGELLTLLTDKIKVEC